MMMTKLLLTSAVCLSALGLSAQLSQKTSTTTYVVPVVFHILHENGPENISDAQVLDAMRMLNEDFQMRNADTSQIVPAFKSVKGSMDVEFRLAKLDPNGNCTNGIEHIQSPLDFYGSDTAKINQWDPSKYLNIWVYKRITTGNTAGYTYEPSQVNANPALDGIAIISNCVGTIGTSDPLSGRLLTRLAGRYFGLLYPWEIGGTLGITCGDDGVSDTPPTKGWPNNCNLSGSICNPPTIENVQNFMEFSDCTRMFTLGQTQVVHNCLSSTQANRNNLWQPANLMATGTDNASFGSTVSCAPIANFTASRRYLCEATNVVFKDNSYHGTPTSWHWEFAGGTPSVSTVSTQTVMYNTAGIYPVKLKVSNSTGSDSVIRTDYMVVRPGVPAVSSISEGFESIAIPNSNWLIDQGFDAYTWNLANTGASGVKSAWIDNYNGAANDVDELVTPSFYLAGAGTSTLTFKVAYAQKSTSNVMSDNGFLRIYSSKDCGYTWALHYIKGGITLRTTTTDIASPFIPGATEWRTDTIRLNAASTGANTMLKFSYTSGILDNNIYLDDINLSSILSVNELSQSVAEVNVSPNPFGQEAIITLSSTKEQAATIVLKDLLGNTVLTVPCNMLMPGENTFTLRQQGMAKGLYLLDISTESGRVTKKVMIQ